MKYENERNMPILAVYNHVFREGWKMFSMMKQLIQGDLSNPKPCFFSMDIDVFFILMRFLPHYKYVK